MTAGDERQATLGRLRAGALLVAALGTPVTALWWSIWVPLPLAVALSIGLLLLLALRLFARVRSLSAGPAWIVWLDEWLVAHWVACGLAALPVGLASVLFPIELPLLALGAYLLVLLPAAWAVWGERFRLEVTEHELGALSLPPNLDGLRCVQISDLHVGPFTRAAFLRRVTEAVARSRPDVVAITGDFVASGSGSYEAVAKFARTLADAVNRRSGLGGVPLCAVLGNHDQDQPERLSALLLNAGVRVLSDEHTALNVRSETLLVAGVGAGSGRRGSVAAALAGCPTTPALLFSHYPNVFASAAAAGVPLVLAGHSHGGQVAVSAPHSRPRGAHLFRDARGLHVHGQSLLYVHRGIGTTGLPLRFGSRPEVAVFVLRTRSRDVRSLEVSTEAPDE